MCVVRACMCLCVFVCVCVFEFTSGIQKGHIRPPVHTYVVCMWYRIRFNFCGVKLSRITNFCGFRVFIFAVCDVIAQALPVWSKFLRDETFADGY